jgi:hypothetical protein
MEQGAWGKGKEKKFTGFNLYAMSHEL